MHIFNDLIVHDKLIVGESCLAAGYVSCMLIHAQQWEQRESRCQWRDFNCRLPEGITDGLKQPTPFVNRRTGLSRLHVVLSLVCQSISLCDSRNYNNY